MDETARSVSVATAKDAVARNLTAARGALGWSQEQLADQAGVSRATVNQLEGGASANGDPRLSTIASLAAALGISPMFLLLDREELHAIAEAPKSQEARDINSFLDAGQLKTMDRLLGSGIAKNRAEAVAMGTAAATLAGISAGPLAAAAIGTVIVPGIGTAVAAAIATAWLSRKKAG
ncbi:helix-turn-helix domain-containing protein [Nocardioides antri]|uniref:helix-turn-helix domain-containing protein n=1 Tax=Nocardioides antri TaxID=2607659 RepID=UPI00165FF388|nr:helix-turn-helix transcriptional regulator [Nocardioides antri]